MRRSAARSLVWMVLLLFAQLAQAQATEPRVRARDLGLAPGIFATGKHNGITDVAGVRIGHVTLHEGENIRTGVSDQVIREQLELYAES